MIVRFGVDESKVIIVLEIENILLMDWLLFIV